MCAGEFSYISKGVSRLPPDKFYDKLFVRELAHKKEMVKYNADKAAIDKKNEENRQNYKSAMDLYNELNTTHNEAAEAQGMSNAEAAGMEKPTEPKEISYPPEPEEKEKRYFNYESLIKHIKDEKLIRIPESYEVTLEFKSLLPNNLNNQLLQYAVKNIIDITETSGTYQMDEVVKNMNNQFLSAYNVAKEWYIDVDMSKKVDKALIQEYN
jgi:hypothetical protein